MFQLVLWTKTKDCSVVGKDEIRTTRDGITKAKWGDRWYEAEIVTKGDSKDFLESLRVTKTGEVLPPEKRSSISADLLVAKREQQAKVKEAKALKAKTALAESRRILKESPIFAAQVSNIKSSVPSKNNKIASSEGEETVQVHATDAVPSTSGVQNDRKQGASGGTKMDRVESESSDDDSTDHDDPSSDNESEEEQKIEEIKEPSILESDEKVPGSCFCQKLSITEADVPKFNLLVQLVRGMSLNSVSADVSAEDLVELIPKSKVLVSAKLTKQLHEHYYKKPRELVRRLMRMIMKDDLKNRSATGKNWDAIPESVYYDVYNYVNDNAPKNKTKYKIDADEYRLVITQLCATERNKGNPNKNHSKKCMQEKKEKQRKTTEKKGIQRDKKDLDVNKKRDQKKVNKESRVDLQKEANHRREKEKSVESEPIKLPEKGKEVPSDKETDGESGAGSGIDDDLSGKDSLRMKNSKQDEEELIQKSEKKAEAKVEKEKDKKKTKDREDLRNELLAKLQALDEEDESNDEVVTGGVKRKKAEEERKTKKRKSR